jgi:pimeloyl-ACP methyl ester carboxylesterase
MANKERAITFGENNILTGIVSLPQEIQKDVMLLFFNAGLLHRVGPHRMYVSLSRGFASEGYLSCRFDLSGLGDSIMRPGAFSEDQRAVIDITEALDTLSRDYSINKFVLIGLCSGADQSLVIAERDPRVVGCVLLDGIGYKTLLYYYHHYRRRLLNINIVSAFLARFFSKKTVADSPEIFIREFPARKKMLKMISDIINRGVKLQFIYSGGVEEYYNYEDQFYDFFPEIKDRKEVQVGYVAGADHTYTFFRERVYLEKLIDGFVKNLS